MHDVAYILHPLWRTEGGNISHELQEGWISYIEKLCDGPVQRNEIEDKLLLFLCKRGPFSRPKSLLRDAMLKPVSWWAKYGRQVPHLQRIAICVLSQDCSSATSERNWSTFGLVQTKKKNRLSFS